VSGGDASPTLTPAPPTPLLRAAAASPRPADREEHLADYHARKANVETAETKLWDEELALHKADTDEAEKSVHRQRVLDWKLRERPEDFAVAMLNMRFPFHVSA